MPSRLFRIVALSVVAVALLAWAVRERLHSRRAVRGRVDRAPAEAGSGEPVPIGTAAQPLDRVVIGLIRASGARMLTTRAAVPVRLLDEESGARIGAFPAGAVLVFVAEPASQRVIAR